MLVCSVPFSLIHHGPHATHANFNLCGENLWSAFGVRYGCCPGARAKRLCHPH